MFLNSKLILAFSLLLLPYSASAECWKFTNQWGNTALKCDSLDQYPDKDPSDNYDGHWGQGHQAGSDWAEKKGIVDPNDCNGYSRSFVEGCQQSLLFK